MTNSDWLINIENAASLVAKELGEEKVRFILQECGNASSVEELSPSRYQDVYNALFDYEVGLKD